MHTSAIRSQFFIPVVPVEPIEVTVVQIPPPTRPDERVEEVKDQPGRERGPSLRGRPLCVVHILVQVLEVESAIQGYAVLIQ